MLPSSTDALTDPSGQGLADRSTEALPVRLHLRGPDAASVERWVGSLGWQPIGADPAVPVTPALTLADVPAVLADVRPDGGFGDGEAAVLLVVDDDPIDAARAASHAGVREVISWPAGRDTLPAAADRLLVRRGRVVVDDLRVAGGAGGVGTTTVALALAGLCAWRARPTLVLRGTQPFRRAGTGQGADGRSEELEGTTAWRGAVPVPGIRGLRRLEVDDPTVPVGEGPAALVVRDLGVSSETDVLVIRRDRAGIEAVRSTTAGVIVVTDTGPAPHAAVRRAAAGRRLVTVPHSARVARAVLRDRVPTGLPGAWLRALEPVLGGRR